MIRIAFVLALVVGACGPGSPGGPTVNNKMNAEPPPSSVVSTDILAREPLANTTQVKHILIGWKDLADAYEGHIDERAAKRTKADAEAQVKAIVAQLQGGADFDTLMKQYSEDTGSAASGHPFTVSPDAKLVIEFRQLGLRLKVGEVGVVQSDYGFHIIKRVE